MNKTQNLLSEMQYFRMWQFQNQKLLQDYYQQGLKDCGVLLVAPLTYDDFCATTFLNHSWMVPCVNN